MGKAVELGQILDMGGRDLFGKVFLILRGKTMVLLGLSIQTVRR